MKQVFLSIFLSILLIIPSINVKALSMGGVEVNTVIEGDGLYEDIYVPGKYVYRGVNTNNYIKFNNELWRIIAKETDGTYKIVRNEFIENRPFNENVNSNDWKTSNLNSYLNGEYYNSLSNEAKQYIVSHDFKVGAVSSNNNLESAIIEENKELWNGNIGLISASDLLNSKSNNKTWLMYDVNYIYWTISPNFKGQLWLVTGGNGYGNLDWNGSIASFGVRPALYLDSNINLIGTGTIDNPFEITGKQSVTDKVETSNDSSDIAQIVEVPSTSAYGSIIIIVLGIICLIVSVFVMRRVTSKNNS